MKTLYHGSPFKLSSIKINQSKGMVDFENKRAVYLTDDYLLACLYACSKHLKGKTKFAVFPYKIIIVGDFDISDGYVYEVDIDNAVECDRRQWTCDNEISTISKIIKINKNKISKYVKHVSNHDELNEFISKIQI